MIYRTPAEQPGDEIKYCKKLVHFPINATLRDKCFFLNICRYYDVSATANRISDTNGFFLFFRMSN